MLLKKDGYYQLEGFLKFPNIIHGFSTREFGDMAAKKSLDENENLDKFLRFFSRSKRDLIMIEQTHGNKIKVVDDNSAGKVIPRVDGLITKQKGIILGVKTADCLSLLFFDPVKNAVGAAHVGWKGIIAKLPALMIKKMKQLGSQAENILVGIGPFIGKCCYEIPEERVEVFKEKFGDLEGMIVRKRDRFFLDLAIPTINQLADVGVREENVETGNICTCCTSDFFSYRKDKKESFGEILSIIGIV